MKPTNLSVVEISPVFIGITTITTLEIDLNHINHGYDKETKSYKKKSRSSFNEIEVANIFSLLNEYFLTPVGKQGSYLYFAEEIEYMKKSYLIAFCIERNSTQTAGIITLYKTRTRK